VLQGCVRGRDPLPPSAFHGEHQRKRLVELQLELDWLCCHATGLEPLVRLAVDVEQQGIGVHEGTAQQRKPSYGDRLPEQALEPGVLDALDHDLLTLVLVAEMHYQRGAQLTRKGWDGFQEGVCQPEHVETRATGAGRRVRMHGRAHLVERTRTALPGGQLREEDRSQQARVQVGQLRGQSRKELLSSVIDRGDAVGRQSVGRRQRGRSR